MIPLHASPDDAIAPLEGWRYLTAWDFPLWALIPMLAILAAYLYGVYVLHRRGDAWPIVRTISFSVLGMGSLAVAMFSFLAVYDTVLFWTHMVQHMLFNMIGPVFLVAGAPLTLALRTLRPVPRKVVLAIVHSWPAKVALFPPLTMALMMGSPYVLYLTGLYDLTLRNDLAHDLLHVWMVGIGYLFFAPLLSVDPVPWKLPYPIRFLIFLLAMPSHAFIGVIIMQATTLIAEDWYVAFERTWGPSPLYDQQLAGGLLWGTGDITMFAGILAIFVQWYADSSREAKRMDRALDREEAFAAKARYDADHAAEPGGAPHTDDEELA